METSGSIETVIKLPDDRHGMTVIRYDSDVSLTTTIQCLLGVNFKHNTQVGPLQCRIVVA